MTALTVLAPALNLPASHAPMLGPEWLDAANLITTIVKWFGPWAIVGVMLVIFAETGLLIGFFLPVGPAIFNKPDSRLFKQEYVDRTSAFFERHGGKAVTLAQFVPIVRTFTPVIAGVGKMHYRHFITFNVLGAAFWAFGITWLGYFLGSFQWIRENIDAMILVIVFISVAPMLASAISKFIRFRRQKS